MAHFILAALLLGAPPANAEPRAEWYGYQTLLSDAAAAGVVALGARTRHGWLIVAGAGVFVLGTPIIHGFHDQEGVGLGDIAMRLLLPPAAALIGGLADHNCRASTDFCAPEGAVYGFGAGVLATSLIDALVLARVEVPAWAARARPTLTSFRGQDGRQHLAAGLAGNF